MNKTIFILPLLVIMVGCLPSIAIKSVGEAPKDPKPFPQLSERNRLLGALLPERTCYDVLHYDINLDIDVDKKYLEGYVDITAVAVADFTTLQIALAKTMQLNGVYFLDKTLTAIRVEDAVIVEFPLLRKGS